MKIESTRFGRLEVTEEQLLHFPYGIPGFLEEKSFVHIPHDAESPFSFLQSTTEANLSFLLVDPFAFFTDYEFKLEDEVAEELGLSLENPPRIFLIASVKEKLKDMTVNLLAPIVLNGVNRTGKQLILDNSKYSIRHRLFSEGLPSKAVEGGL